MIQIDQAKCNGCGLCIRVCHEYCMQLDNGILTIDHPYCSTCTQCIAVCPQLALSWDHIRPLPFEDSLYPRPEQLEELFKERRTIRDFRNKKIERSLLEEIAGYAVYAPTHDFNLRVIIIDDDAVISRVDALVLKLSSRLYRWLYKPRLTGLLLKWFTPEQETEYLRAKPKLESALNRNAGLRSRPAAIIMVIGNKRVPLSLESAQYALYNVDLYAQAKGLGCRNLVGNQMILNRNRAFKRLLGLQKRERIYGTILLGYPAVRFRNKVLGKQLRIQWNRLQN